MSGCRILALALALSAALLVAAPAAAKPLILWHAYRAAERSALEATVKRWNEGARGKDPKVKLLAVPYDAFPDKISAAIPRGHGPDLFIFAHDRVGDWAEAKVVEPIEFWMTEKHADAFIFKAIDALCYKDSLYGLPMAFKSTALYYNKALVPSPPTSTKELLALGRKLTDVQAGNYGLVYDNVKLYFHAPWLFGFGGKIFDAKGRVKIDSPQARQAMAFAAALGRKGGIVPPEASSTLTTTLFNKGKAAMAISGPWMLGELSPKLRVGVAPLPTITANGKPASPFLGAEGVMMSAKSKRKAAGFRAMTYLTGDRAAVARALSARQPVANHAAWKNARVKADPVLRAFRAQLDSATVMPGTPQMRLVWSPYDMALQKVMSGRATPGQALKEAAAEVRRFLKAMKREGSK
jgi:arabinogalactan oligomer/maltooligosaccharide transport system substrate-binding protein